MALAARVGREGHSELDIPSAVLGRIWITPRNNGKRQLRHVRRHRDHVGNGFLAQLNRQVAAADMLLRPNSGPRRLLAR